MASIAGKAQTRILKNKLLFPILFLALFLPTTGSASGEVNFKVTHSNSKPELYFIKKDGSLEYVCGLEILHKGKAVYNWGKELQQLELNKKGKVTTDFVETRMSLNHPTGGGIYVSLDPWDSSDYGSHLLIGRITKDAIIAPWDKVQDFISKHKMSLSSSEIGRALKAAGVDGSLSGMAENLSDTTSRRWLSFYNYVPLQDVHMAHFDELLVLFNQDMQKQKAYPYDGEAFLLGNLLLLANLGPIHAGQVHFDEKKYSAAHKLLIGQSLTHGEKERLVPIFGPALGSFNGSIKGIIVARPSELAQRVAGELLTEKEVIIFLLKVMISNPEVNVPLKSLDSLFKYFHRVEEIFHGKLMSEREKLEFLGSESQEWLRSLKVALDTLSEVDLHLAKNVFAKNVFKQFQLEIPCSSRESLAKKLEVSHQVHMCRMEL